MRFIAMSASPEMKICRALPFSCNPAAGLARRFYTNVPVAGLTAATALWAASKIIAALRIFLSVWPDADIRDLALPMDALPAVTKLEIGPACAHLEVGRTFAFKAWGTTLSGNKIDVTAQVAWVSAKPGVATFSATTPGVATAVAAGDFDISVSGWGLTATLPGRVAAWATTKLDYDVDPKDFHVVTTSLGVTPDRAGLAVAAWLVPDSTSRMGVSYREYDPATAAWSASATLDTGTAGDVFDVRMRVGPTGNLLALGAGLFRRQPFRKLRDLFLVDLVNPSTASVCWGERLA
jgi:hypothetical protein